MKIREDVIDKYKRYQAMVEAWHSMLCIALLQSGARCRTRVADGRELCQRHEKARLEKKVQAYVRFPRGEASSE